MTDNTERIKRMASMFPYFLFNNDGQYNSARGSGENDKSIQLF